MGFKKIGWIWNCCFSGTINWLWIKLINLKGTDQSLKWLFFSNCKFFICVLHECRDTEIFNQVHLSNLCINCHAIEISVMPCKFLLSGVFFYSASSFKFLSLNYNRDVFIKRAFLSFKRYTAVLFRFSLPGAFISFNFRFLNVTVWNLDIFHIKSRHSSHTMQCLSSFLHFPIFLVKSWFCRESPKPKRDLLFLFSVL